MNNIPKHWVTISEFERLTGLKNRTIMLAVKRKIIPDDCVGRPDNNDVSDAFLFDDVPTIEKQEKKTTVPYYIDPQQAAVYWYENVSNLNRQASYEIREKLEKYILTFNPEFMNRNKDEPPELSDEDNMSYKEATRKEMVAKAKLKELELKEKEGSLVKKEVVYDQLFAFGQEMRNAFLTIPDRTVDSIIASANRTQTHSLIYEAIATELKKLSDINNRI